MSLSVAFLFRWWCEVGIEVAGGEPDRGRIAVAGDGADLGGVAGEEVLRDTPTSRANVRDAGRTAPGPRPWRSARRIDRPPERKCGAGDLRSIWIQLSKTDSCD
jgi:hypothetical protein